MNTFPQSGKRLEGSELFRRRNEGDDGRSVQSFSNRSQKNGDILKGLCVYPMSSKKTICSFLAKRAAPME